MLKLILTGALAGWAGIIGFAYWLANARIAICYIHDEDCLIRTTATRDNVLIAGLIVALVALILLGFSIARRFPSARPGWRKANREGPVRLR